MLRALTQTVSDLRNRLKEKACGNQSSRGLELVELEDRILYSASPIVGELMAAVDGVSPEAPAGDWSPFCATDDATDTVDPSLLETDGAGWRSDKSLQPESKTANDPPSSASQFPGASTDPSHLTALDSPTSEAPSGQHEAARTQLVFVDQTVQDYERLLSDVLTSREDAQPVDVILLDGSRDGMEQITEELANRDDLDAVHIVSHGVDGKLKLGNVWLLTGSIEGYAGDLASWGNSLSDEADLLLYGCDLADGEDGRELVEAISVLTGADVAASVDETGHGSLGGDWELEYSTGLIETNTVFSYLVRDNWHGLLDAAVVVVDTSADTSDGDTTSIAALQADKGADGLISLREAILAANNTPNSGVPDEIHFDIGAGGIQTIQPISALPTISDAVVIDGTTQLGYSGSPIIELDGTLTTWDDGIVVSGGGTTIRGLVINRFDGGGIRIIGAGANVIEGNYIGTDISGNNALGNGGDGIEVTTGGNRIGGTTAEQRNVISGNSQNGIRIHGAGATLNLVQGNYIGTNAAGTTVVANNMDGIQIESSNNTIGGSAASAGNIVGGNLDDGISIDSGATGNTIQGNYIGTEASGSLNLANADNGIEVADGSSNVIGGTSAGEGNTVANNLNTGITVEQGTQNEIRGNSIYDNAGLGIDLDTSGVAANDAGDVDSGANQLQNYPVLSSAMVSASELTISGTFSSEVNTTYEIDFYSNIIPDGSGHGEGEVYLGSTTVNTNASGSAGFNVTLPGVTTADGDLISATATDPAGNTSEFGANITATSDDPPILLTEVPVTIDGSEDDIWNAAAAHEIHHVTIGEVTDASDLSGTWKSLWDNDYLYFLVDVTDDFLIDDSGPGDPWMDDIVEIFIDADASQGVSYDGINDFHFGFRWNDSTVYVGPNSVADTTGVTFSLFNTPSGYRLEAAIPWTTLGVQPGVDELIAMDVQVADDDDGGARDGKRGWYATAEVSFHDPSAFVPALLVDSQAISFWMSTSEDVTSPSGAPGADSWSGGTFLRFGNPGLGLEPGATNGFFTTPANLDAFADDGSANVDALHFVTQDITIGGANAVSVSVGDILISTADDESFTSTNSVSVTDGDLLLVQFDTPGDYSSATFTVILDDVETLLGFDDLTSISLVEMDTDIGDATVYAGEFLFTRDGVDEQNDIYVFHTADVGEGTTAGTAEVLIEGTQIGIDQAITGMELIEQSISAGGKAIMAGQILLTLDGDDDDIGDDLLDTNQQDFFALDVAQTTLVDGTAVVDADLIFEGADIGLNSTQEDLDALSLVFTGNSPIADIGGPYSISEGDPLSLDASGTTDPDGELLSYSWDMNGDGVFDDVTGQMPDLSWDALRGFGIDDDGTYELKLQVEDGKGGIDRVSTTLTVSNTDPTLAATGTPWAKVNHAFTLDLNVVEPGDDTITGWTINWGDGTIDTIVGSPASVSHVYTTVDFTYNILATATDEDGTYALGEVVTSSLGSDSLFSFDGATGGLLQQFATGDGLDDPVDVEVGPDGMLYVTGFASNDILRYDASSGAFVDQFVTPGSGGLLDPSRMAFGPGGHLYVTSSGSDEVLRYDGTTGAFVDAFVTAGSGGLDAPDGILFGPDANLYVTSSSDGSVLRYDGTTGAFIDSFALTGGSGYTDLEYGPDGNLHVSNLSLNKVLRFNGTTGAFIDDFVSAGSGGLNGAAGLSFGPDGNLYVVGRDGNNVLRYDGTTGAFVDEFVSSGAGLNLPVDVEFLPSHQVLVRYNIPPVADAGGPHTISEGDSLTLDASASFDADMDPLTYAWDIDNDGSYDDATGESPTLTWAQLLSLGINDDGTYTIGVEVPAAQILFTIGDHFEGLHIQRGRSR